MVSAAAPRDRRGFEIALICALPLEAECVQELFDKFWEDEGKKYGRAAGDPNTYTAGVIGEYNVILAYMPSMGINNAAAVAGAMRVSFPNIKLALVVGICGGMPHDTDREEILLGDIIISQALIQYDFGRQYPEAFKRKDTIQDSLSRPSPEIRAVQAKLGTSRYKQRMQDNIAAFLQAVQENLPNTKPPTRDNDVLYHSSYVHQHLASAACECGEGGQICEAALRMECEDLGCGPVMRVTRNRLMDISTTQPMVHFGVMGSGNTVMKSGQHRDGIATTDGIIAFEMEGAGVWDYFPSIIIKGVCDYADSHKRKGWQRYAAATAAACMKAFLVERTSEDRQTSPVSNTYFLVPRQRVKKFFGREVELEKISAFFNCEVEEPRILILCALGGQGKSQIALEYCQRSGVAYQGIFWINSTSKSTTTQSLVSVARELDGSAFEALDDDDAKVKFALRTLEQWDDRWLLVFDNYVETNAEDPYIHSQRQDSDLCSSNVKEQDAQVDWNSVQRFLLASKADCLILLDCCFAAKGGKDRGTVFNGINEVIAACSSDTETTGVERRSFTSVLTRHLDELAHRFLKTGKRITVVALHSDLFCFSRELQFSAFYVRLTNEEFSSIDLTPLPPETVVEQVPPGSVSLATPQSTPSVIVAFHLSSSPRGDLVAFLLGEGLIPEYVTGVEVRDIVEEGEPVLEGIFVSNSTLVIMSIPMAVWNLMPEHVSCTFIGITYSRNLLVNPQALGSETVNAVRKTEISAGSDKQLVLFRESSAKVSSSATLKKAMRVSGDTVEECLDQFKERFPGLDSFNYPQSMKNLKVLYGALQALEEAEGGRTLQAPTSCIKTIVTVLDECTVLTRRIISDFRQEPETRKQDSDLGREAAILAAEIGFFLRTYGISKEVPTLGLTQIERREFAVLKRQKDVWTADLEAAKRKIAELTTIIEESTVRTQTSEPVEGDDQAKLLHIGRLHTAIACLGLRRPRQHGSDTWEELKGELPTLLDHVNGINEQLREIEEPESDAHSIFTFGAKSPPNIQDASSQSAAPSVSTQTDSNVSARRDPLADKSSKGWKRRSNRGKSDE